MMQITRNSRCFIMKLKYEKRREERVANKILDKRGSLEKTLGSTGFVEIDQV